MDDRTFDALTRWLRRGSIRRLSLWSALVGLAAFASGDAALETEAGKRAKRQRRKRRRKQKRICRAVCGGNCGSCRQRCAVCPRDNCPICVFEAEDDFLCVPDIPETNCERCSTSDECEMEPATCLTGFTDLNSGTTRRFPGCGKYPAGVCAILKVACMIPI